ncbi:uracil-DNA glycosylase DNA polymerase processivity factor [Eastern grey kangaroopox virus]|uniref:Uracil-DNA glycosylase n=1 Tax=Eastern grey kangaroopox virus TaxID=2042482 RepID=A0A2C9DT58_9POXV|nr:uracil-DNA glycosylase DNA polymerase processivity factor [Eastern grey kangaroopox virus]ATI21191.1 uracil-DNA glycosylase DNA polymerase processivity factor [Eastern grey kangaroopox virus]ATX75097.1 uracil-DNA glycosylase, DNA polymerase processivity factor [Eastern grey kangaroopox virus]
MAGLRELRVEEWPHVIRYHPDWEPVMGRLAGELAEVGSWLLRDEPSPRSEDIFRQLSVPLTDKRVCLVGIDPYPNGATGVPFQSPDFSKRTIRTIATNLSRRCGISLYGNYDFALVEGVLPWNYYLSCRRGETKSHALYWERLANAFLSHIARFVKVFYFMGKTDFANYASKLDVPVSVVLGYHPAARGGQFDSEETFEIVNALLALHGLPAVNWAQGFLAL